MPKARTAIEVLDSEIARLSERVTTYAKRVASLDERITKLTGERAVAEGFRAGLTEDIDVRQQARKTLKG